MRTIVYRACALIALCLVMVFSMTGCKRATIETYVDPTLGSETVKRVAIFPFTNAAINPEQSQEINRKMAMAIGRMNSNIEIVSPAEVIAQMSNNGLADEWARFLRDYETSGIPNGQILSKVGQTLKVDAVMQGEILGLEQRDAGSIIALNPISGKIKLTLRFNLLSTTSTLASRLLWWSSCEAELEQSSRFSSQPKLFEALNLAADKTLATMPTFKPTK